MLRSHHNSLYEQFRRQHRQRHQKRQKILIVPLSHTRANPRAVVVKFLDTGTAVLAVNCSRRAVNVTGVAEFEGQVVTLDNDAVVFLEVT
jgi:hypothetical protein